MLPEYLLALALSSPALPPVTAADLEKFPSREVAWAGYEFAVEHVRWVEGRSPCWERLDAWEWRTEARQCHMAWDLLADSWGRIPQAMSLSHLERLRCLLGPEAYYAGRMPPCCPWWRFEMRP